MRPANEELAYACAGGCGRPATRGAFGLERKTCGDKRCQSKAAVLARGKSSGDKPKVMRKTSAAATSLTKAELKRRLSTPMRLEGTGEAVARAEERYYASLAREAGLELASINEAIQLASILLDAGETAAAHELVEKAQTWQAESVMRKRRLMLQDDASAQAAREALGD